MQIILIADIFGITPELLRLAQDIALVNGETQSSCVKVFGPYKKDNIAFANEQAAYEYFTKYVGLDNYTQALAHEIAQIATTTLLIGFSVGGSALWRLTPSLPSQVKAAICFYSGQIRHHLDVKPNHPTRLILAEHEVHFSVDSLATALEYNTTVLIEKSKYLHGFMNPLSVNFSKSGYQFYVNKIRADFS